MRPILPASAVNRSLADIRKVQGMVAKMISGSDVKATVHVYDNVYDNTEGNPCAATGINYIVDVQVRKSVLSQIPDGSVGQTRNWEDVNTLYIS